MKGRFLQAVTTLGVLLLLVAGAGGQLDLVGLQRPGAGQHLLQRHHGVDRAAERHVDPGDVQQGDGRGDELLRPGELGQRALVVLVLVQLLAALVALARLAAHRIGSGRLARVGPPQYEDDRQRGGRGPDDHQ